MPLTQTLSRHKFSKGGSTIKNPPPLPLEKVPVNRHRLDAARIISLRAVYQVTDGINL